MQKGRHRTFRPLYFAFLIVHLFLLSCLKRFHFFYELVRRHLAMYRFINDDNRRNAARADTVYPFNRELEICRRVLARGDGQFLYQAVYQTRGTLYVTRGSAARRDHVPAPWLQMELRIERRDAVEPRKRDVELVGDPGDRVFTQIAEFALEVLQDRDQVPFVLAIPQ